MKDEVEGDHIVEFISGGAKNYGYRTARGKVECKVSGFTLNVRGKSVLNYDSMKRTILTVLKDGSSNPAEVTNPNHFHRDQTNKTMKLTGETRSQTMA